MDYQLDEKLESLLLEKSYEQLSGSEKNYVSQYCEAPETYHKWRLILSKKNGVPHGPSPALRGKMMAAFQEHHARRRVQRPLFVRVATQRIPLWKAAAVACLLVFSAMAIDKIPYKGQQSMPVLAQHTDTVYQVVYKTDTVFSTDKMEKAGTKRINQKPGNDGQYAGKGMAHQKHSPTEKERPDRNGAAFSLSGKQFSQFSEPYDSQYFTKVMMPRNVGQPIGKDTALWKFFMEVN